jgi:hypothetical protein
MTMPAGKCRGLASRVTPEQREESEAGTKVDLSAFKVPYLL